MRELRLAKRMARLGTETAFEVLVKARALEAKGRDIVHLEIGEPDFDTPGNVIEAACDALHKGFTHYGPSAGMPPLREMPEMLFRDASFGLTSKWRAGGFTRAGSCWRG